MRLKQVCDAIIDLLPHSENNLGFVSPTHFVLQMVSIVEELRRRGHYPTIVYNTNGYDLPETIRSLEGMVDVWLPDFKYSDNYLAEALSQAPEYSRYALSSFKEMMYQAGTTLHIDDRGIARRGIIIRHLVLPGFVDNSHGVLKMIADNLSLNLHISLMSQYYPPDRLVNRKFETATKGNSRIRSVGKQAQSRTRSAGTQVENLSLQPIGSLSQESGRLKSGLSGSGLNPVHKMSVGKSLLRPITRDEYESIVDAFHDMGFTRGWLQEYESHGTYQPDFSKEHPFE